MKKISVLLFLIILLCSTTPAQANFLENQKTKIKQAKTYNSNINDIKALINLQTKLANEHNKQALKELYSKNFVNSDGLNKDLYMKLIDDTFKTYPDITYKTKIKNVKVSNNYAEVLVTETAFATSNEMFDEFNFSDNINNLGELYSVAKSIYHLERQGAKWFINAEQILEETSTLKFGKATKLNIELNAPKVSGADKDYTATLKVNLPKNFVAIASISKENITYPQNKSNDVFRKVPEDNTIERVFHSNNENVNEYAVASVGFAHAEPYKIDKIKIYMDGFAFIMTRINIIPENKLVNFEKEDLQEGEQNAQGK